MNTIKNYWLLIVLFIVFLGYGLIMSRRGESTVPSGEVKLVNAYEFDDIAKDPLVFVLDVHTPEQTHIGGTDAFIPYDQIEEHILELPEDKNTPILIYCRSGNMSAAAAKVLSSMGYSTIYDLEGGIAAYKESHVNVFITPEVHDFGTVVYGDIPIQTFTLTNFTPQKLTITKVSTSCGCTTADLVPQTLEPYGEVPFTVSFNPAIHKDDTDLGHLTRTIYIDTDNPNFAQVTAQIRANVIRKEVTGI